MVIWTLVVERIISSACLSPGTLGTPSLSNTPHLCPAHCPHCTVAPAQRSQEYRLHNTSHRSWGNSQTHHLSRGEHRATPLRDRAPRPSDPSSSSAADPRGSSPGRRSQSLGAEPEPEPGPVWRSQVKAARRHGWQHARLPAAGCDFAHQTVTTNSYCSGGRADRACWKCKTNSGRLLGDISDLSILVPCWFSVQITHSWSGLAYNELLLSETKVVYEPEYLFSSWE